MENGFKKNCPMSIGQLKNDSIFYLSAIISPSG
jgi:hypothetical protein